MYLISDTHFNHVRIQEYTGRPNNWQETLIANWNSIVGNDDIILHLGDFALGTKENFMDVYSRLNGQIYLLKGNHDRFSTKFYTEIGIHVIKPFYLNWNGVVIYFSHCPLIMFGPGLNIHGHIHNLDRVSSQHFNISVENINYSPVTIDYILERS